MISFIASTRVILSENLYETLREIFQQEGIKRIGLIIDNNLAQQASISLLLARLEKEMELRIFCQDSREPGVEDVDNLVKKFVGFIPEMLIGIGGGSIIDLTKAASVMLVNGGKTEDYHCTNKYFDKALKKIMIPTTAGTGSEVTPGAVLINRKTNIKRALAHKCVTPEYAILYPEFTLSLSDYLTAITGMDALVHAIESYTARSSNIITRMFSKEAFRMIYNNLKEVFANPKDIAIRKNILIGSCLAGFAIFNSNTGACHSMSYALGIYHSVPHSLAVSLLIPEIIQINIEKGCYLYADLFSLIEGASLSGGPEEKSLEFLFRIKRLISDGILPKNLQNFQLNSSNYKFLAQRGLDLTGALENNPVDFSLKDAERALLKLI